MKAATLFVFGCSVAAVAPSLATTYAPPHILDGSGHLTDNGGSSPLHLPMTTTATLDVFGPDGDTGAFSYNYAGPIRWNGTDFEGRAFSITFDVQFCQSRPEGNGYRFELLADPALETFQGFVVNAHSSFLDLSVFGFDPEPIGSGAGVTLDTPAMHFAGLDSNGRDVSVDLDPGTLRIVPAPVSAALLAIAGLFKRRHR